MDHDPYFAGRPPDKTPNEQKSLLTGWCIVYGLNLIVPLYFGVGVTERGGRLGMSFAILLVFGTGCWTVPRFREIGKATNIGGSLVALMQIFPLLQIAAGFIGILVASNMGLTIGKGSAGSELGGFVATVLTGGILIAVALLIGSMVQGVSAWFLRPRPEPTKKPGGLDVL